MWTCGRTVLVVGGEGPSAGPHLCRTSLLRNKNAREAAIFTSVTVRNWKHQNKSNVLIEKCLAIDVK